MKKYVVLHSREYLENNENIRIFIDEVNGYHEPHAHDFIEIVYVASGAAVQTISNCNMHIKKGDLFLINTNVVHSYKSTPDNPLVIYNCLFEPLYVDNSFKDCENFIDVAYQYTLHTLLSEKPKDYIKLCGIQYSSIESLLLGMHSELELKQSGYRQILQSDLIKLLIYIFRIYKSDNFQKQDDEMYNMLIVQNTVVYLKQHFAEEIKCEQLAKRSYISTANLNKLFKEISGYTVLETLQNIRINVSCDLLESTKKSIQDIAAEVGYSDRKFFYELFKRKKGMLPGEYRKKFNIV